MTQETPIRKSRGFFVLICIENLKVVRKTIRKSFGKHEGSVLITIAKAIKTVSS